jgi:hypothetical protein
MMIAARALDAQRATPNKIPLVLLIERMIAASPEGLKNESLIH